MKYILSSFGLNNPYIVSDVPDHAVYPIGIEGDDFIDLDYSILLAGTSFLFDKAALEYLTAEQSRLPFIKPLIHSINKLAEEGFLETFDGKAILGEHIEQVKEKTELLCENVEAWIGPVRSQWKVLKDDRDLFLEKFGSKERKAINEHHFSVTNAVIKIDGSLNLTLLKELIKLVDSKRRNFTSKEREYLKEIVRPLVCHTVLQDLTRYKTGGAVLDWEDSEPYYQRLYVSRWENDEDRILAKHTQSLFNISLPELKPKGVNDVIKFIRNNHNVRYLREDIINILQNGEKFDLTLGKKITKEVLDSQLANKKKMKKFRYLGAFLSFIPGGSLLTEAAIEGANIVSEDLIEKKLGSNHRWFYSLIE